MSHPSLGQQQDDLNPAHRSRNTPPDCSLTFLEARFTPRPPIMPPRLHNTLSYFIAALVFALVAPWHKSGVPLIGGLWIFHFGRRTVESLIVHRYSGRPIKAADFLVEYLYYWGVAGWVGWSLGGQEWSLPSGPTFGVGVGVFALGEFGNTWAHQKLKRLRAEAGQSDRRVPHGGLFDLVSCPHYLFEILSWCGFFLATQLLASLVFWLLGAGILGSYAYNRHKAYRSEFDGKSGREEYPPRRKALLPFVF